MKRISNTEWYLLFLAAIGQTIFAGCLLFGSGEDNTEAHRAAEKAAYWVKRYEELTGE